MLHHGKERLFQFGRSDRKGTIGIKILVLIWIYWIDYLKD